MEIVVVNVGDTLWSIANQYGFSVEMVSDLNQIDPSESLVPGQSIIVPTISTRNWSNYLRQRQIEVNAYLRANDPNVVSLVNQYAKFLTYFSIASYRLTASGELTTVDDTSALNAIAQKDAIPMLVVTNFTGEEFSPNITRQLFQNKDLQETFLENLLTILNQKNYRAVNFDFEENYPEDKELYNSFLRTITPKLREAGFLVSTTLAPKISPTQPVAWFGGLDHDYTAHGEIVDFVILMAYDIGGWFQGAPMAVSPLPKVKEVLDYATSVLPSNKILLGLPLYGYDWTLPFDPKTDIAETIGPEQAVDRARKEGAMIQYDGVTQAPFYRYFDQGGQEHIVWFEDARSMEVKLNLVNDYNLRGVSYFPLGKEFPQNWVMLTNMFNIKKL